MRSITEDCSDKEGRKEVSKAFFHFSLLLFLLLAFQENAIPASCNVVVVASEKKEGREKGDEQERERDCYFSLSLVSE